MRISRLITIAVAAVVITGAAQAATRDTVHKAFNVAEGGTLTLDTDLGDVKVIAGGSGVTIDVDREIRDQHALKELQMTFDQQGNDVRATAKLPQRSHLFQWRNPIELKFTVHVPARYNLKVSTSGGDLDVSDITGAVDCRTSGGDVELGRISGTVSAHTSGGDMKLGGVTGEARLTTSGGSIDIDDAGASVEAKTSGGSIDINRAGGAVVARTSGGGIHIGSAGGAIDAVTSGGSITATFAQQPQSESRLSTSGGGVTVSIGPAIAVDLEAHASGGGVSADVPVTVQGTQDEDSLVGKINGGGPKLVVRTSGGGIRLKRM